MDGQAALLLFMIAPSLASYSHNIFKRKEIGKSQWRPQSPFKEYQSPTLCAKKCHRSTNYCNACQILEGTKQMRTGTVDYGQEPVPSEENITIWAHEAMDCSDIIYRNSSMVEEIYAVIGYKSVLCDQEGWTLIQRRGQFGNPVDYFDRGWEEYRRGFGEADKEYWLGNDHIHYLTNLYDYTLRIIVTDHNGVEGVGYWNSFKVTDQATSYTLLIDDFDSSSSNLPNEMRRNNRYKFSTPDRDNDLHCARAYRSGWWYTYFGCHTVHLNGYNYNGNFSSNRGRGIVWDFYGNMEYSFAQAQMAIRRSDHTG